jgi:hypothetical protein
LPTKQRKKPKVRRGFCSRHGGLLHSFLTSELDECQRLVSRPWHFILEKIAQGTHWKLSDLVPKAGLESSKRRKTFYHCWESNLKTYNSKSSDYTEQATSVPESNKTFGETCMTKSSLTCRTPDWIVSEGRVWGRREMLAKCWLYSFKDKVAWQTEE